jgi:glucose-6-phosphate-specific signal transduction histidine kinase
MVALPPLEGRVRRSRITSVRRGGRAPGVIAWGLWGLSNAAKYADASRVVVRLDDGPGELCFEVIDDGAGFDPVRARGGTGLQGMADRLAAIGGEIEIRSAIGDGTTVIGRVPVEATP